MKPLQLLKKLPFRLVVGLFITLIGVLILGITLLLRPSSNKTGPPAPAVQLPAFNPAETILVGNKLLNLQTGATISDEWLKGFSFMPDLLRVSKEQNLVLTRANYGQIASFGFSDGILKPQLSLDDKPIGAAAFNRDFTRSIFVRDQDLWIGDVNWDRCVIEKPSKLTDTGYFRRETFQSNWLWIGDTLLVPFMIRTLQIDVASGKVNEIPVNIAVLQNGISPDGTFILHQGPDRVLQVSEHLTGKKSSHALKLPIRKYLWLSPTTVAFVMGQDLVARYDHQQGKVFGPHEVGSSVIDIAAPSPNGEFLFLACQSGLAFFDLTTQKTSELPSRFSEIEWINDDQFLASSPDINTDNRGLWLVNKDGSKSRVSTQPVDHATIGQKSNSLVRTPQGAAMIIGGDLWVYLSASNELRRLTTSAKLPPQLKLLAALR